MTALVTRIQEIQTLLHCSSREMAEKAGLCEADYRNELENPSDTFITRLCTSIGVSERYLRYGKGPVFTERSLPVADILAFRDARNWKQFHAPKDLAISLSLESSELLECFQWSGRDLEVVEKKQAMEEELADILIYSVLFADAIGVDIPTIIKEKLEKNGRKYAVEHAYGNAKKYTEFTDAE